MRRSMSYLILVWLLAVLVIAACAPIQNTASASVTLDKGISGTLRQPDGLAAGAKAPVVLLLHGFGSSKDEVGGMYARLADQLAAQGVGSLRIDFEGFGKSDGDTGSTTVAGQIGDAETAYNYLKGVEWVDPARMGVLGFSLGGGIASMTAAAHPEWFKSLATWSSVGNFDKDFSGPPYDDARKLAAEKGVVGIDLGFRTMVLKDAFFSTMKDFDIADAVTKFPGAYLAVAGDQDFSVQYAQKFVDSASGSPKEAYIVKGGDHIYGVLGEDQTMANDVIDHTAEWFAKTLAGQ